MNEEKYTSDALGADKDVELNTNRLDCAKALSCWYITGATASGKTQVSSILAERLNAEIISLDSMAIYRGMDIGTAKPGPELLSQLPHHLIDIRDPVQSFSVSEYRDLALEKIDEIQAKGKSVIFVGGTALYLKALLRGLFDGPPADWEFRKQIEAELEGVESSQLHQRLSNIDPVSGHQLHPNDRRRIIRALEVYKLTGKPISHWQTQEEHVVSSEECKVFTLRHARPLLHQRIEDRVDQMFEAGLVQEVQDLMDKWGELGHTASQAVGYQEVISHIRGEMDFETTVERVRIRTRRFARHQETWFRGLEECRIIDLPEDFNEQETVNQILSLGGEA